MGTPAWSAGLTVGQDVVWMSARAGLGSIDDGNFRASGWLIRPQVGFNKYFKEKASPVRSYATASTYTLIGGISQDQEVDFIARGSFLLGLTGGFGLEAQISERCSLAAGVAVECVWDVADARLIYTRRTTKKSSRIDLVLRRSDHGGLLHAIELKVIDGRRRTNRQLQGVRKDIMSLRAMLGWEELAAAWVVLLVHSFPSEDGGHVTELGYTVSAGMHFGTPSPRAFTRAVRRYAPFKNCSGTARCR